MNTAQLTNSAKRVYPCLVTANSVTGFSSSNSLRRDSANTSAGAFFTPAERVYTGNPVSLYGGSRGETFGSAGNLRPRSANPARSATQLFSSNGGSSLISLWSSTMPNSAPAVPAINPSELRIIDGQITTTSMQVAEHFGKRHDDVLKRIRALDCSGEFHARNFAEMIIEVAVGKGATRKDPAFRMTRDGFTFLCMGFTGKEAAKWKEAYINAFNQMEAELQQQASPNAMLVPADEDTILLHYNRRPLFVYRQGQDFWYRAAHVSALVGARDSHSLTRALPQTEVRLMHAGNQKVSWLSHRGLLASLGRLKANEAAALLNWLQLTIPGAFTPTTAQPTQSEALNQADPSSLLRAVLAGNRFLCTLDDMGRITLREIPNDHLIIAPDRIPTWIADPQGPKPAALATILQAVSHRMGRAA